MSLVTGRPALLREHNMALILGALRNETLSRADLARTTGLAGQTVSRLVDELVNAGLVEHFRQGEPRGGRPGMLLRLRPDGAYIIGADLGRRGIRIILADLTARVLADTESERGATSDDDIKTIARDVERVIAACHIDRAKVVGMGIGVPGPLDLDRGLVLTPPNLPGWSFVPLRERLTALLEMPVVLDNNANVAAYGEYLFCHRNLRTMVYVHAGTGIGAGVVIDGHLYRGHGNAAGAIGHTTIDLDGPACSCGRRGCLEALASVGAMLAAYQAKTGSTARPPARAEYMDLLDAGRAGNTAAVNALTQGGRALGVGLANLVNTVDPEIVVLGGGAFLSNTYRSAAINEMRERTFVPSGADIPVKLAGLGRHAIALGAASVLLKRFFESPLHMTANANASPVGSQAGEVTPTGERSNE